MKKIIAVFFMLFAFTGGSFAFEDIFVEEKPPVTEQQTAQKEATVVDVPFDWFDISDKEKTARINDYSEIIFGENSKIYLYLFSFLLAYVGLIIFYLVFIMLHLIVKIEDILLLI